ncbi:MAG: FAD-dependent oxidoreductase [Myxococcales bacterium]|jgi:NADPH-dependent glutamate synthase beta subunit-like oxidoreductase|nr:FAD-dependent oxidoreductase [Myxococcales bacterium]
MKMEKIKFTLDGVAREAAKGTTILAAAKQAGKFIPTFCHLKELKPFSSCFVCVVEVKGRANLVPSCSTALADGMEIVTEGERIDQARRTCVELLLSDHEGDCLGPCMVACPAGIDIPGFIYHIAQGDDRAAHELIHHNMPLPGILGRVCTRPCEDACRRQLVEKDLAICHLKRFAADQVAASGDEYVPACAPDTGKRVAIVGAGPAGLTAAYYLQILGHACTVYDMHEKSGGMTRYGIPSYRLPRDVIERETDTIAQLGASFRYGVRMGKDVQLAELQQQYDAVFLATGAQKAKAMRVDGEDIDGVMSGIGFLEMVSRDETHRTGDVVMVVGGGNTAIDAARTALRCGAKEVSILYRRTRAEMPALAIEIDAADEEGVNIDILAAPVKIERGADGRLHVTCIRMELGEPDASGRRRPVPKPNSEHVRVVDVAISAIGQDVDASVLTGLTLTRWDSIDADLHTGETNLPGVFAGGDCVTGADIAVTAVGAGRRAAIAIDQYLNGLKVVGDVVKYNHFMGELKDVDRKSVEGFAPTPRVPMGELSAATRTRSFDEVEVGFTVEEARAEARRCMECGCRDAHECRLRTYASAFGAQQHRYTGVKRTFDRDVSHDAVVYEAHKCIQCGICVRTADELLHTASMGFTDRGIASRVKPAMARPLGDIDDTGIDQMVDNCPVGALTHKADSVPTLPSRFVRPTPRGK